MRWVKKARWAPDKRVWDHTRWRSLWEDRARGWDHAIWRCHWDKSSGGRLVLGANAWQGEM